MARFESEAFGMSEELMALINHALRECLDRAATGNSVMPTVYYSLNGTTCTVVRGSEQSPEEISRLGWGLEKRKPPYFVLVIEGHLTTEAEPRTPALFAQGFEQDRADGVQFAQRYRRATKGIPFAPMGNLSFLGRIPRYSSPA
ncbi:MAG: hypothetical protein ACRDGS_15830 [Chloroflexota bacterium]